MSFGGLVDDILNDIGWDSRVGIPVANAENKALLNELLKKQNRVAELQVEVTAENDRKTAMANHYKNVGQELQHTQNILTAQDKALKTEQHMCFVAADETGRYKQLIKDRKNELKVYMELNNRLRNSKYTINKETDELKGDKALDQEALNVWFDESMRKFEDADFINKYTKEDNAKIKKLSLELEAVTEQRNKLKRQLEHHISEANIAEIELNKTAEDFRRTHSERQVLIRQWENIIDLMEKRDKDLNNLAQQMQKTAADNHKRIDMIKMKQQFLDSEIENNAEVEKFISMSERNLGKLKAQYQDADTQRIQCKDELNSLKIQVDRCTADLFNTRQQTNELKDKITDTEIRLDGSKAERGKLMKKLKLVTETTLSAEEKAAQMDELLEAEDRKQKDIQEVLEDLRDVLFRKMAEAKAIHTKEKDIEAEIQGSQTAFKQNAKNIVRLDDDALKQQEIIYSQDIRLQTVKRRIGKMEGECSHEEKIEMEEKIGELTEDLSDKNNTAILLNTQLKRLQDDTRAVNCELERCAKEKESLCGKIDEYKFNIDSADRELKKLIARRENLMVEHNMMKLAMKRQRELLNEHSDDVMDLEKQRLMLETAMKERLQEIKIHMEMLQSQIRAVSEQKQQINMELHERFSKIEKLKKRYEIITAAMAPPEGEQKTQAHYIIKIALEREELQRQGDDLDAKIKKAEKEMRALGNTLKIIQHSNQACKRNFTKIDSTGNEMETQQELNERLRAAMDRWKYKRRQVQELREDIQSMVNTLDNIERDQHAYTETIADKKRRVNKLNTEVDEQRVKIERVTKQNLRYSREIRSAYNSGEATEEERDFRVRELRDFIRGVIQHLMEAIQVHPELTDPIIAYFAEANLPPISGRWSGSTRSSLSINSPGQSSRNVDLPPLSGRWSGSSRSTRSVTSSAHTSRNVDLPPLSDRWSESSRSSRSANSSGPKSPSSSVGSFDPERSRTDGRP